MIHNHLFSFRLDYKQIVIILIWKYWQLTIRKINLGGRNTRNKRDREDKRRSKLIRAHSKLRSAVELKKQQIPTQHRIHSKFYVVVFVFVLNILIITHNSHFVRMSPHIADRQINEWMWKPVDWVLQLTHRLRYRPVTFIVYFVRVKSWSLQNPKNKQTIKTETNAKFSYKCRRRTDVESIDGNPAFYLIFFKSDRNALLHIASGCW